ncbi:MAG: nucleotide-binding protein [Nitrospirae bacterium]|nr:nucleotide-binding protein [Nitrospirota bacterium]
MFNTKALAREYNRYIDTTNTPQWQVFNNQTDQLYKKIDIKIHRLESIIGRLELFPLIEALSTESSEAITEQAPVAHSRKIFVVHGHDEIAKTNLEIFLNKIGLEPVVLHRQADEGLTVIEKFEKHSDVGYAFILLTPDEIAYLKAEASKPDDQRKTEYRARPNVIFEFGYFVGKLGRSRVCCLYTGDVSLPSDIHGWIYKKFDKSIDEIKYDIIEELKKAKYAIKT